MASRRPTGAVADADHVPRTWHRHRRGRILVAVALGLGVVAGLAAPASAHATLESTNPPNGTALARSPGEVVLHFDQQVSVSPTSIEVFNASAKRVDSGNTKHVPNDSHSVETAIPASLPAGGYVVTWRVVSADSHPVNGAFTFFIGAATGGSAISSEAGKLLAQSSGSKTVGVVYGIVRFLAFAGVAVFLGGLMFATVIWPDALEERRARAILWSGLALLALATAAAFALQGVYGAGFGLSQALKSTVLKQVWNTRFGKSYAARLAFLAVAGVLVVRLRHRTSSAARVVYLCLSAVIGVAILATWGLADHASTGSLVWLAVPFDVVHLGAASIWLGGLVMIVAVLLPASRRVPGGDTSARRQALLRFSQWALAAVVAIVATGVFAAWRQVGVSWGALRTTPYGKLVIYKSVGLAALVLLASVSRTSVHGGLVLPGARPRGQSTDPVPLAPRRDPRPVGADVAVPNWRRDATTRLGYAVGAEIAVILAVLGLTAVLVNARPAKQAYAAPFSTEVKAGPTLVNVVVDPAKAGPLAVHLYILTSAGIIDNVPEVDATMSDTGAGINGLKLPLQQAGPGHFLVYGFDVPIAGTWTINVTVRTDAIDEYFSDPIVVHIR